MVLCAGVSSPINVTPNTDETFDIIIDYTCQYNEVEFLAPVQNFILNTNGEVLAFDPQLLRH